MAWKKKAFTITSTWIIMIVFFSMFLMLGVLFYTGFNLYQLASLTLYYPSDYEERLLVHAVHQCFTYYDSYTFDHYAYLVDPHKVNTANLSTCIQYPGNISVRVFSDEADRLNKRITTPKWVSDDAVYDKKVIFIDDYEQYTGTLRVGVSQ